MKSFSIPVKEFALPVPRVGSIEANSGYAWGASDGQQIHQLLQEQRLAADPKYSSEVPISATFERGEYQFVVSGRMDGFFDTETPRIEEIKSCFNIQELRRKLVRSLDTHPYCLQLKTYGYFYWLQEKKIPDLALYLISSRNAKSETLELTLDTSDYESWLDLRLDELEQEAKRADARIKRRRKWAASFQFPFENPRSGQMELISEINEGMKAEVPMLIQAPTGLGKTAGVLYPTLKEALERGQSVIYVTPKNSQHTVAEDAVERFQSTGTKVRSLTLTAKSKICFKNEPLCNPEYCEFAKDHYTKVSANNLPELLSKKKKLEIKTFQRMGEEFEVCPFELQFEAAKEAEVIIGDYNYVFSPRASVGRLAAGGLGAEGKPNLVIDEAHNLYSRALSYYSPEVSTYSLQKMRESIADIPSRFQGEVERLIDECIFTITSCQPEKGSGPQVIEAPIDAFHEQDASLRAFLSRYLESDIEIQPKDVVLRLSYYWSEFTSTLEYVTEPKRPEFFTTYRPHGSGGGSVRITCCDASEFIRECYDDYGQVVAFSATLKPFDYYAKLSGIDTARVKQAEFLSPFPKENRKVLIIPEISTKYSQREKNYDKVSEVIRRISEVRPGNYFAFFPSFEFLEKVMDRFTAPPGFTAIRQFREMRPEDVQAVMDQLRQSVPTIVFAVQGGIFSEGVDYPGDMIIGAFVVGPPLPNFELERERMRTFYDQNYGAGFHYAYSYPAMAKAVQAAGRVVRSETDKGLIVLMDGRFLEANYFKSMPSDWFEKSPTELVSRSILKEVQEFWSSHETQPGSEDVIPSDS